MAHYNGQDSQMTDSGRKLDSMRVLYLSGSLDDVPDVERMLQKADIIPAVRHVSDLHSLWQQIDEFCPDLILLDNATPDLSCESVLKEAGEQLTGRLPFVCVADALSEEEAIDLLKCGARDFVVKYRPGRLAVAVSRLKREVEERQELKRIEDALRRSESLLARSQRIAKIGSWSWNLGTGEFIWSDEMYRIFGLDKETSRPSIKRLMHCIHKDDRELVDKQMAEVQKGSRFFRIKHRVVRPDGEVRFILAEGEILPLESGEDSNQMIGMILDETERHEADEWAARLTTAIEQAGEAVAITDRYGRIHYSNSAFCDLVKMSREGVIGKGTELLERTNHDAAFYRVVWDTLRAGDVWSGRVAIKNTDNALGYIDATVAPVKDASGEIVDFVLVCHNVTEQLDLERQLRQAQKAEAIGTLAGGIARDFNNILAAMIGFTEIALYEQEKGKTVKESMEQVLKAGMRGRELIKQLLVFGRRQTQEYRLVSMGPLILDLLKFLKSTFPSNIEIRHNVGKHSPIVLGDQAELQQALVNLCTNAMQAMPENGGVIYIEVNTRSVDASLAAKMGMRQGPYVRISITDTGAGMDESALEHAFDPFFSTRKPERASGLGLPVAFGIIKSHSGTITVESEAGKGSTFHVFLPRVEAEADAEGDYPAARHAGHETILYVDDEEVIVDMVRHTLEQIGYQVTAVTDPSLALEHFLKEPKRFDLVITDQIMPGMTGTELAKVLLSLRPDIPIVLTTGFSESINAATARSIGIRAFVMKPLTRAELAETIRLVLENEEFVEKGPSL
jgi:PAS domain S-box-containing protein